MLEILGAPTGCSFHRAYNYRRGWVSEDFLDGLASEASRDIEAVVGMRFRRAEDEEPAREHHRFIPLRFATAQVLRDETSVDIHLRLFDYVPLNPGTRDLWALEVEEAHRFNPKGGPMLAWHATPSELADIERWRGEARPAPTGLLWEKLRTSALLSAEARDNLRNRVVPFATEVRDQRSGAALKPAEIQKSSRGVKVFGYELKVDRRIDVDFETRRIIEPDVVEPPSAPDFEFITNPELVQAATSTVPFTGNYRQTPVTLRPRAVAQGRADLQWAPRFPADSAPHDPRGDVGLRLPFRTARSWPITIITIAISFMLLGVGLVTWAINEQDFSEFTRSAFQTIGVGLISASVAFATKALDDIRRQS